MAVTVNQYPPAYYPGYSDQYFEATSTQTAQPNFVYRIVCTDLISSATQTYDVPARPDGTCVFNAGSFAESRLTQYCPVNAYGWQLATGIRKIRVNIGEYYGATPSLHTGSNYDYIVWNAVQDFLDVPGFDITDYKYQSASGNYVYLTSQLPQFTYEDRSNLFYALATGASDLMEVKIVTYDSAGNSLGSSIIANSYESSTTYTDKYNCIDIGYKGLYNISSGLITGTYPIITSQVAYYNVYIKGYNSLVTPFYDLYKTITVGCEPKFTVYTLHFLKKNGAFETVNFSKRSDLESTKQETTYKKIPYTKGTGTYAYSRTASVSQVLSTQRTDRLKLNTDWLTEDEVSLYKELFDSPLIYLDLGSSLHYPTLRCVTSSYKENKAYNEKLFQLQMDFEYTHENNRQRI